MGLVTAGARRGAVARIKSAFPCVQTWNMGLTVRGHGAHRTRPGYQVPTRALHDSYTNINARTHHARARLDRTAHTRTHSPRHSRGTFARTPLTTHGGRAISPTGPEYVEKHAIAHGIHRDQFE